MLFNVPQFLDIEDKIVGPFTAKQLGWLAIGGVILLVLFNFLDMEAFIMSAVFVVVIIGALAFYRPYNQPLISFLFSGISFIFRPKIYVWKRLPEVVKHIKKTPPIQKVDKHSLDPNKVEEISHLLDESRKSS